MKRIVIGVIVIAILTASAAGVYAYARDGHDANFSHEDISALAETELRGRTFRATSVGPPTAAEFDCTDATFRPNGIWIVRCSVEYTAYPDSVPTRTHESYLMRLSDDTGSVIE